MYILYDDEGIIEKGSLQKCINSILEWTESEEAKKIYTKSELKEIYNHFECTTTTTSFYGFNIEKINN